MIRIELKMDILTLINFLENRNVRKVYTEGLHAEHIGVHVFMAEVGIPIYNVLDHGQTAQYNKWRDEKLKTLVHLDNDSGFNVYISKVDYDKIKRELIDFDNNKHYLQYIKVCINPCNKKCIGYEKSGRSLYTGELCKYAQLIDTSMYKCIKSDTKEV